MVYHTDVFISPEMVNFSENISADDVVVVSGRNFSYLNKQEYNAVLRTFSNVSYKVLLLDYPYALCELKKTTYSGGQAYKINNNVYLLISGQWYTFGDRRYLVKNHHIYTDLR